MADHFRRGAQHRRRAEAELGNGPLHREQDPRTAVGQKILPPHSVEERSGEIAAVRAAVEQEELAHHRGHALVVVLAVLVTPAGQHRTNPPDLLFDQSAPEDTAGQCEPVEVAQPVEAGKAAQMVGVPAQERPHRPLGPVGYLHPKCLVAVPQKVQPLLRGPVPVRAANFRAPQNHNSDGVVHGAPHAHGGRRVEAGVDLVQRLYETADESPLRGIGVVMA
ncbi:hypothetical protein ABZT28_52550 [Streptomyces sp. NPDC005388]|uniref:hypothetical protein n=1 Tax=Streptomyces sp. NPDC005388 TaxID=3156717 RepID=UPI00339E13C1